MIITLKNGMQFRRTCYKFDLALLETGLKGKTHIYVGLSTGDGHYYYLKDDIIINVPKEHHLAIAECN
jgi:hypothetical protein